MTSQPARIFPVIEGQRGLATVAQLIEHGWTWSALRQARARSFSEPMPRVLAPHRGPIDAGTRVTAMALWAGGKAVYTGRQALALHGVKVAPAGPVTLVVPDTGRARQHKRVRVVRSSREVTVALKGGPLRVADAARALADAAVYEARAPAELEHLAIAVLQRGLTTPEALERELWMRPQAKVSAVWRGLEGFTNGAWSRPEVVLREVVEGDGGFPPLVTNCQLVGEGGEVLGTPDGYLEDAGTAIQVHSRQHHQGLDDQGGDRWAQTVEKDSAYVAAGVRVIAVTPWTLYSKPRRFLTRLRQVVDLGLASPRPAVRVVPRDS